MSELTDWGSNGRLKAKINFHSSERGLPGSVILYTQNAYERLWDRSLISNLMYDCDLADKWKLHADAGFNGSFNRHLDNNPIYPTPQDSRYSQNEYSFALRSLYAPAAGWQIVLAEDIFCMKKPRAPCTCSFPVPKNHSFSTLTHSTYWPSIPTGTPSYHHTAY